MTAHVSCAASLHFLAPPIFFPTTHNPACILPWNLWSDFLYVVSLFLKMNEDALQIVPWNCRTKSPSLKTSRNRRKWSFYQNSFRKNLGDILFLQKQNMYRCACVGAFPLRELWEFRDVSSHTCFKAGRACSCPSHFLLQMIQWSNIFHEDICWEYLNSLLLFQGYYMYIDELITRWKWMQNPYKHKLSKRRLVYICRGISLLCNIYIYLIFFKPS